MSVGGSEAPVTHLHIEDRSSFDAFYRREYRPLLKLAWSLTGRRDLGEELVQEVMVTVHGKWRTIGGYDRPGGFARRVLLNDVAAPEPPPDDEFWDAIRALPERQAQAVALHYMEDRPITEIAEILDISTNTVKVHLHRGRLALAESLRIEEDNR